MNDELSAFRNDLWQEVRATATAEGGYTREALMEVLANRLATAEELSDHLPCFFEGTGSRSRQLLIDGYSDSDLLLDGSLRLITVIQGDGHKDDVLATGAIHNAYKQATAFYTDAVAGRLHDTIEQSNPAADLAQLIHDNRDGIKTVKVFVLSDLPVGKELKAVEREPLGSSSAEMHVWDLGRFFKLAAAGGHEPIDLDITQYVEDGLPALNASVGTTDHKSYLCVVPGTFLADIYAHFGGRLLEGNVRAFLSARGNVNKGLRATIRSRPDRFFAYNNGITATAGGVKLNTHGRITRIVDLQIVNGGQTTASLYNTRARDGASLDKIYVQMKLSVVSVDLAQELIPDIARYANTQNKVSEADLFANHPFNRKVEEMSRRIWAPGRSGAEMTHWFYERARAQYESEQMKLTASKRRVFLLQNPKPQVITKTDLAKFENTWRKRPYEVSRGAQKNFSEFASVAADEFEKDEHRFNDPWFQHLVSKAILFKETERIVSNAAWYLRAYRANIVTYAVSRLVYMIEEEHSGLALNLREIWRTQALPDPVQKQLEVIGECAQHVITKPPSETYNITEWAKKKQCWENLMSEDIPIEPKLVNHLIDAKELRDEVNVIKRNEREAETIDFVVEVVKLAQSGYWNRALKSSDAQRELSPTELGILKTAVQRGSAWVPSDAQARRLMAAKSKLDDVGFR